MTLHVDFETRSTVDLKKTGVYAYAADPTTDIWCMTYAFGDGPVRVWTPGQPAPDDVVEHILAGGVLTAHKAAFERVIWHYILAPRYGFPEPDTTQWRCTMVTAYSMGLPGSLENAAPAAGIDIGKDMVGRRLMLQMSRPRKIEKDGTIVWWDDPEKIEKLIAYCKNDVEVERALDKRLRPLSESELALWHLDQRINDRGVLVDEALCHAAKKIVAQAQDNLDAAMRTKTNGDVSACSNRNQLVKWIRDQGVECDSVAKAAMETLLEEDSPIPPHVREVLLIRQESAKASVAKIDALLNGKSPEDNRAKGLLQFNATTTRRWGGRRFQPQNLKRPEEQDIDTLIDAIATGDFEYVSLLYDQPLSAVSDILRGMIIAAPGHRIVASDYSAIEGRVLPWLAGEDWKVEAYLEYDRSLILDDAGRPVRKNGEKQYAKDDMYCVSASKILGRHITKKDKHERQAYGKVPELALGYQGGVGAFKQMAANYGVDLPDSEIETIRDGWREAHPAIKRFWYDLESAAIEAVKNKGSVQSVGRIRYKMVGSFLAARLPSGGFLFYPYPQVREFDVPWGGTKEGLTYFSVIDVSKRGKIVDDPKNTPTWSRVKTYGGELSNHKTQGTARDILADAMPRLEAAGYPLTLSVHDEAVTEPPEGHGSVDEMEKIMCDLPAWAAGLPVSAEGFENVRYRK